MSGGSTISNMDNYVVGSILLFIYRQVRINFTSNCCSWIRVQLAPNIEFYSLQWRFIYLQLSPHTSVPAITWFSQTVPVITPWLCWIATNARSPVSTRAMSPSGAHIHSGKRRREAIQKPGVCLDAVFILLMLRFMWTGTGVVWAFIGCCESCWQSSRLCIKGVVHEMWEGLYHRSPPCHVTRYLIWATHNKSWSTAADI